MLLQKKLKFIFIKCKFSKDVAPIILPSFNKLSAKIGIKMYVRKTKILLVTRRVITTSKLFLLEYLESKFKQTFIIFIAVCDLCLYIFFY